MLFPRLEDNGKETVTLNALQRAVRGELLEKWNKGIYAREEVDCPVCHKSDQTEVGRKDRYGLPYRTVACNLCGLLYVSPRMTQEAYNAFYNAEYRKLYLGKETVSEDYFRPRLMRGKRIYDFLSKQQLLKEAPLKVLEIGCSAGHILKYFQDQGHEVTGVDLGEEYVEFGKTNYGLNLKKGTIADIDPAAEFDLIIYSDVLEHVLDLEGELELLRGLAKDQTIIFVQVPGVKNLEGNYQRDLLRYFQNAHTFHFSKLTLFNLFRANGFEEVVGDESVRAVFKVSEKPKPVVKNDFPALISYLKKTERLRPYHSLTVPRLKAKAHGFGHKMARRLGMTVLFYQLFGKPEQF